MPCKFASPYAVAPRNDEWPAVLFEEFMRWDSGEMTEVSMDFIVEEWALMFFAYNIVEIMREVR